MTKNSSLYIIKYNLCIQNAIREGKSMNSYQIKAFAKINLGLDVVRRLENGYHEVKMVMQTVGIYDELALTRTEEGITVTTDTEELPTDDNNLIYKAAKIMMETYHIEGGIHIHLKKNIPIAAGMAGGSTDAAATFKGINRLYDLDCTLEELMKLGVKVGADVPYCILGGTALAEGIGEKLTSLNPSPDCYVLVAKPPINVSTKYVYEHLDAEGIEEHPDIDGMVGAIWEESLQGILDRMGNVLENVTEKKYPIIGELKNEMKELGALNSLMSGSGPTVFGIFIDERIAREAFETLKKENPECQVFLTGFY